MQQNDKQKELPFQRHEQTWSSKVYHWWKHTLFGMPKSNILRNPYLNQPGGFWDKLKAESAERDLRPATNVQKNDQQPVITTSHNDSSAQSQQVPGTSF
jgi:hypothetical protein